MMKFTEKRLQDETYNSVKIMFRQIKTPSGKTYVIGTASVVGPISGKSMSFSETADTKKQAFEKIKIELNKRNT